MIRVTRLHLHAAGVLLAAVLLGSSANAASEPQGLGGEGSVFQAVLVPDDGRTILYVADIDTNAPVTGASVEIEAAGWQGGAAPTKTDGVYALAWEPPPDGADVTLMISGGGKDDLVLVQAVGRKAPDAPESAKDRVLLGWKTLGGAGAVLLVGGIALARRVRKASAAALALGLLAASPAFAHGGEDHGDATAAQPQAQPGTPIAMPKATQFLLGIRTEKIEAREAADTVRVVGRVAPDPQGFARVQPSQPARVISDPAFPIPVPGQQVKRGQVLAILEPTLSTLEKGDKRATLSRVESEYAITEREVARLEALGTLVPAKQIETARIRLDQLRKERTQIGGTALGREVLLSPVDGVVTDVHVVPGEVVLPDRVLVEIVDPARLRVEAVVHDLSVAQRISGATAASKLLPDQTFTLSLLGVSPKIDPVDQGVHAVFQVASGQVESLKIGMPVDVFLATGAATLRIAVPRDAIAEAGGRQVVFVRTQPEAFEARPVKVERVIGPLAEVSEGVRPGDRVVTQGIGQLAAGR